MKRKIGTISIAMGVLILVLVPLFGACAPKPAAPAGPVKEVRILHLNDLTGPISALMTPYAEGVDDFAVYFNEKGEIPGVKIAIRTIDTKWNFALGQSAYEKYKSEIIGVMGWSLWFDYLIEVTPRDKIVNFCGSGTAKGLQQPWPYNYLCNPWTPDQTAGQLKYWKEKMHKGNEPLKVAIIVTDALTGRAYITGIPKYMKENGISLIATQPVPMGANDMSTELTALAKLKPDIILSSMAADQQAVCTKNRYDLKINIPLVCVSAGDLDTQIKILGAEPVEGVYYAIHAGVAYDVEKNPGKVPMLKMAQDWWIKKHGNPNFGQYGNGMAHAYVVCEAIKRALKSVPVDKLTGETLNQYGMSDFKERMTNGGLNGGFQVTPGVEHVGERWGRMLQAQKGKSVPITDYYEFPKIRPPFE